MMRQALLAAAAALALSACNQQGSGPPLPPLQQGAQAPATLTPQPGVRQHRVTEEVRQQITEGMSRYLDFYASQYAAPGMAAPEGMSDQVFTMQPGGDHRFLVQLTGNAPYTVLGACDDDCSNIDIELIDMRTGGVVASDMLADDFPVVNFVPPADGQYMVRTLMQVCTAAPCFAGARILTQSAASSAAK